jgi:hypothetical protein
MRLGSILRGRDIRIGGDDRDAVPWAHASATQRIGKVLYALRPKFERVSNGMCRVWMHERKFGWVNSSGAEKEMCRILTVAADMSADIGI